MLIAALAYLVIQPAATAVVWEQPPAAVEAASGASSEATPGRPATTLPDWALTDPFGYERARCNPMVRGAKTLEACQAETRIALATALGDDLPDALRPPGMAGDCQMIQAAGGGVPQLKRVLAVHGKRVAMASTLDEALRELFRPAPDAPAPEEPVEAPPPAPCDSL